MCVLRSSLVIFYVARLVDAVIVVQWWGDGCVFMTTLGLCKPQHCRGRRGATPHLKTQGASRGGESCRRTDLGDVHGQWRHRTKRPPLMMAGCLSSFICSLLKAPIIPGRSLDTTHASAHAVVRQNRSAIRFATPTHPVLSGQSWCTLIFPDRYGATASRQPSVNFPPCKTNLATRANVPT